MQKRSLMQISSLITLLSILTILLQFAGYYFFSSEVLILSLSCLITAVSTYIILEQALSYEACFIYTILTLFVSLIITLLTYLGKEQSFIPYTNLLLVIVAVNWFIPNIVAFIRSMFDYGTRIEGFRPFFRNISILFLLFYAGVLFYAEFSKDSSFIASQPILDGMNFSPFMKLSSQIEDYIYKETDLASIVNYLAGCILIYLPYGFYCNLILRKRSRLLRFASLLILPVIIELTQFFQFKNRVDIDDVIYALFGGLFGIALYTIMNLIYRAISGKNFLAKESDFRYSKSSLHF